MCYLSDIKCPLEAYGLLVVHVFKHLYYIRTTLFQMLFFFPFPPFLWMDQIFQPSMDVGNGSLPIAQPNSLSLFLKCHLYL